MIDESRLACSLHSLVLEKDVLHVAERVTALVEALDNPNESDDPRVKEPEPGVRGVRWLDETEGNVAVEDLVGNAGLLEHLGRPEEVRAPPR